MQDSNQCWYCGGNGVCLAPNELEVQTTGAFCTEPEDCPSYIDYTLVIDDDDDDDCSDIGCSSIHVGE